MQTALLKFIDFPPEVQTVLMSAFVLLAPALVQLCFVSLKKRIKFIESALRENTKLTRDSLNEQKKTNSMISLNRTRHRASDDNPTRQPATEPEPGAPEGTE